MNTLRFPSGSVRIRGGTEGPSYDPYHYTEIIVKRDGRTILLHSGLAEYLKVDGVKQPASYGSLEHAFFLLSGLWPKQWMHLFHKLVARRMRKCEKCGCKHFEDMAGFPGESFTVCSKCHNIVDTHFHLSEII